MNSLSALRALCAIVLACASLCQAAPVVLGGTVSSPNSSMGCQSASHAGDQSGLSTGYVSGVTPFNSYVGSVTHTPLPCNTGYDFTPPPSLPRFTLDLGGMHAVDALAMWDGDLGPVAVGTVFKLWADSVDNVKNGNDLLLGTFATIPVLSTFGLATVFSFGSINVQAFHIELQPTSHSIGRGIGEWAVRAESQVPEPGSLALAGLGLMLAGWALRRRLAPLARRDFSATA